MALESLIAAVTILCRGPLARPPDLRSGTMRIKLEENKDSVEGRVKGYRDG